MGSFVLRAEGDTDNPLLPVPYGKQSTYGRLVYYDKGGASGTQTKFICILGMGEMDGLDRVYYGSNALPEFDSAGNRVWQFHPGTLSTGFADPIQGRPTFFPELDFTFSEIAYIEVMLPAELSSDDQDEPSDMFFLVRGRKVQNYTLSGNDLVPSGGKIFSANNALVAADIMTSFMGQPLSRIHGPSLLAFRDKCDERLDWVGGNDAPQSDEDIYESEINMAVNASGGATKVDADGWTAGATTRSVLPSGTDGFFEVIAGYGTFAAGYCTTSTITNSANMLVGIQCNQNGIWSSNNAGANTAVGSFNHGDIFKIAVEGGQFAIYRNGVKQNVAVPAVPNNIRACVIGFTSGAGVTSATIQPAATVASTGGARTVPRYEANVVFVSDTEAVAALNAVMVRAPGCHWQDVNGKIKFIATPSYTDITDGTPLPAGGRALVGKLTYDPTQVVVRSNIVEKSFSAYRKSVLDKPNHLRGSFRNRESEFYDEAYSNADRRLLRAQAKALIDPGIINFGVSTQSLTDRILETQMRVSSDLDLYVSVKGQANTHTFAKGDIVQLSHDVPGWRESDPPLFMIMDETFEPTVGEGGSADDRSFTLQLYSPDFYSDTAHGPISGVLRSSLPSIFTPPPVLDSLNIEASSRSLPDGTLIPAIVGTAVFTAAPYKQQGYVWIKRPGDADFSSTNIVLTPDPTTNEAVFSVDIVESGLHEIRVVTASLAGVSLQPLSVHLTDSVNVTASVPPAANSISLSFESIYGPNRTFIVRINGTVDFGGFSGVQRGRLYYSLDGGAYVDTGIMLIPNLSGQSKFSMVAPATGSYVFKVVTESPSGVTGSPATDLLSSALVVDITVSLNSPTNAVGVFDGNVITYTWRDPVTAPEKIQEYQLSSDNTFTIGNRIFSGRATSAAEVVASYPPGTAPASVVRYLRALDYEGNYSGTVTITVPFDVSVSPSNTALVYDGTNLITSWYYADPSGYEFEVATANNGTGILTKTGAQSFVESNFSTASRVLTRYVRSISPHGNVSVWIAAGPITVTAPGAPTLSWGTVYPFHAILNITPPVGINRQYIRRTVIETSDTSNFAVIQSTLRFDGMQETAEISGRFASTPTVYVRVYYEDAFGTGTTSSVTSQSFAALAGSDIATGAISLTKFASGIEPVTIVSSVPGTKSTETIYNTTDQKLYKWNGSAYVVATPSAFSDLTGTITSAQIADAAITTAKFAAGIEPVTIVSSVPGTFSTNSIFNTTDRKLYRWNGTAYIATLAATDLTGQITSTQITDDAITTPKIAANAVTASEIAANTITSAQIAADTITAGQIAAAAISTSELAALAVTAEKIAVGTITAAQIAALTITAAQIAAATITGDKVAANTITASNIAANTITAGEIAAAAITASELAAGAVTADKIAAGEIYTRHLVVGGLSDNLLSNPSYEIQQAGLADGWVEYGGAYSLQTYGTNQGSYVRMSTSAGITSKIIPVVPNETIAIKFTAWGTSLPTSFSTYAQFRTTKESYQFYIGDITAGEVVVPQEWITLTNAINLNGAATTYEFTFTVPANRYWMSITFHNVSGQANVDDVLVKRLLGSAFISDLSAEKLVAATGDIGLLFADNIVGRDFVETVSADTLLNGALTDSASTINVTASSTTGFPSVGGLLIENEEGSDREIVYYTGKTSSSFTGVSRGQEGTTAVAHLSGVKVTARGVGWSLNPSRAGGAATGEFNSGITIQNVPITEVQARSILAISNNKKWRGSSTTTVPEDFISRGFIEEYDADSVNNRMFVAIGINIDEWDNAASGADSINACEIIIKNKFGELVTQNGDARRYRPWNGYAHIGDFKYDRKYADAWEEAVFQVRIHNYHGWSDNPIYISNGRKNPSWLAGGIWSADGTPPVFLARQNCPLELTAVPAAPDTIQLNWQAAIANTSTQNVWMRVRGADNRWSSWSNIASPSSSATSYSWTSALSFSEYEFYIQNTGSTGATSNIAYCCTPPQSATVSRPAPSNVIGSAQSTTSIVWNWTRNATDNTDVEYSLDGGSWTSLASASVTTLTSTVSAGTTHSLRVRNKWSSGTTYSAEASSNNVTTPASTPVSTDPSNLNLSTPDQGEIFAQWTNNGSVNQTLEYRKGADSYTVVSLGAVSSYSITGLLSNTLYDVRVKATSGSNYVYNSILTQSIPDEDPYCVVLDSLISLSDWTTRPAYGITEDDILNTGKSNLTEIDEIVIGTTFGLFYVMNEFGDILGCSPSHPFLLDIKETKVITAAALFQKIQNHEKVFVKMNDEGREFLAEIINIEYLPTDSKVWIPKLRSTDHTFIANKYVCHNIKRPY